MLFHIKTRAEYEAVKQHEAGVLQHWNDSFETTMELLTAHNEFYRQKQIGMGGSQLNSGEHIVEARMPIQLLALNLRTNPNFLEDDKEWYSYLRKHPKLRSYDYDKKDKRIIV